MELQKMLNDSKFVTRKCNSMVTQKQIMKTEMKLPIIQKF